MLNFTRFVDCAESEWRGFKRIDFNFEGREAILVLPKAANAERNWLLKTEYFDAFQDFEYEMVCRGWHLAFIKNVTRWCIDEDLDLKARFAAALAEELGLYPKCVPVGMSCGGMIAVKLAARHPECVSALYLDAPVMNLLSCPAGLGNGRAKSMPEFTEHTGMTLIDLLSYREHPIDKMHILLANDIPVVLVVGDSDPVVPYLENGLGLENYYKKNGGRIRVWVKPGCAHHPHGLTDREAEVADTIEAFSRENDEKRA